MEVYSHSISWRYQVMWLRNLLTSKAFLWFYSIWLGVIEAQSSLLEIVCDLRPRGGILVIWSHPEEPEWDSTHPILKDLMGQGRGLGVTELKLGEFSASLWTLLWSEVMSSFLLEDRELSRCPLGTSSSPKSMILWKIQPVLPMN